MFRVRIDGAEAEAEAVDRNPRTRDAVRDALPLEGEATRWGDELYFGTSLGIEPEETTTVVPEGGVAYWPSGDAVCLFWGPTPASEGDEPRAASPVNVFARVQDTEVFEGIGGGVSVRLDTR